MKTIKKIELYKIYIICGLILGMLFSLVIPVRTTPDEPLHLAQAYAVSDYMMGSDVVIAGGVAERSDDYTYYNRTNRYNWNDYKAYWETIDDPIVNDEMVNAGQRKIDNLYPYFIASLGITLGRALHFGPWLTLNLGRLCNLVMFVILMAFALKLIPIGKELLFVILMLPMTIQQSMSYSYDVMVISFSILETGIFLWLDYSENIALKKQVIAIAIMTILAGFIFPIKGHAYFLLFLLPIYSALHLFTGDKKDSIWKAIKILVLTLIVLIIAAWILIVLHPNILPSKIGYVDWAQKDGFTVTYLLHHPWTFIKVMGATFTYQFGADFVSTLVGTSLGFMDIPIPDIFSYAFLALLVMSAFRTESDNIFLTRRNKLFFAGINLLTVIAICAGMLLTWTPIDQFYVNGIQGRYFIPVMFMILILLNNDHVKISSQVRARLPYFAAGLDILVPVFILGFAYVTT